MLRLTHGVDADDAWLLARARGEAAEHPDPARARGYERLERALAGPPAREPPADFEAELFAALEHDAGAGADHSATQLRPEGGAAPRGAAGQPGQRPGGAGSRS